MAGEDHQLGGRDARPIVVVLNPGSGPRQAASLRAQLHEWLAGGGRDVRFAEISAGSSLQAAVAQAIESNPAAIVAGGGDGTVNGVAAALLGRDIPLGIIPLGTLNHFAKDLGLPLDPRQAVEVILRGQSLQIDVAEVNGRVFLNNSSVGLYPRVVRLRDQHPVKGFGKWIVAAWALLRELRRHRRLELTVMVDGKEIRRRASLLMVGNNEYRMEGIDASSRDSLSDGQLVIYVVTTSGAGQLLALIGKILMGVAMQAPELDVVRTERATVAIHHSPVEVAFDGEVERFPTPLEYRIRPKALRVLV